MLDKMIDRLILSQSGRPRATGTFHKEFHMCCINSKWMMFTLVGFAAVLTAGLSIAALPAHPPEQHATGAQGAQSAQEKMDTITGELIDTACFISGEGDAKGKEHAECATKCMATGIPAGILPEGSKDAKALLVLLTNPAPLAQYASQTIRVEGKAHPDMHAFDVKKAFVKDGENWKEIPLDDEHHHMGGAGHDDGHTDHKH